MIDNNIGKIKASSIFNSISYDLGLWGVCSNQKLSTFQRFINEDFQSRALCVQAMHYITSSNIGMRLVLELNPKVVLISCWIPPLPVHSDPFFGDLALSTNMKATRCLCYLCSLDISNKSIPTYSSKASHIAIVSSFISNKHVLICLHLITRLQVPSKASTG
jgi:hypothetical protein